MGKMEYCARFRNRTVAYAVYTRMTAHFKNTNPEMIQKFKLRGPVIVLYEGMDMGVFEITAAHTHARYQLKKAGA